MTTVERTAHIMALDKIVHLLDNMDKKSVSQIIGTVAASVSMLAQILKAEMESR